VGSVIRLVRANLALLDAALAGDESLAEQLGHRVVPGWVTFTLALSTCPRRRGAHPALDLTAAG
jgi:[ribosomal protein S5]-alanine N-acetyltransferase